MITPTRHFCQIKLMDNKMMEMFYENRYNRCRGKALAGLCRPAFPEHSKGGSFRVVYQTGSVKVSEMQKSPMFRALSRIDGRAESHGAVSERRDQTGWRTALSEQSSFRRDFRHMPP